MSSKLPTESIDQDVYTGFWINRPHGKFYGSTLTLDQQTGGLLIAFLAMFIGATGRSLWKIVRFIIHTSFSSNDPEDGIYHQRQAVLRNTPIAEDAAWEFLRMIHTWRDRAHRRHRRLLPMTTLALLSSTGFMLAGIFSSKSLTNTSNEVLIAGRDCGALEIDPLPDDTMPANLPASLEYLGPKITEFFTYAAQCYQSNVTLRTRNCGSFVRPNIPYTIDKAAPCPFSEEMCQSGNKNLRLSASVDSVEHLGLINGPRFSSHTTTHCAPLNTRNFTRIITTSDASITTIYYEYGVQGNGSFIHKAEWDRRAVDPAGDYRITVLSTMDDVGAEFIPQLVRPRALVTIIFLDASRIEYVWNTTDPWFSATTFRKESQTFLPDIHGGVLGCITKTSHCNPSLTEDVGCFDAYYNGDPSANITRAWPDTKDQSSLRFWLNSLGSFGLKTVDWLYMVPGQPSLLARGTVYNSGQMAVLPDDAWQSEREYIFQANLAGMQSTTVEYARGFWPGRGMYCEEGDKCERTCHSQKVRSSSFYSFSVWVLTLILVLGVIIMLLATFIDVIFDLALQHTALGKKGKLVYSRAEWHTYSTLQLQRIAHENLSTGTWSKTDDDVPVTKIGQALGVLDITDEKHAILVAPALEMIEMKTEITNVESAASDTLPLVSR